MRYLYTARVLLALFVGSGCGSLVEGLVAADQNDLATVIHIEGGPPSFTGPAGKATIVKLNQGFNGIVAVKEGQVLVDHYLPYKEIVEELRRKRAETPVRLP